MPKVNQKKPVEVVEPPKEEKRAPVFRLFECLVHLEQARDHVAKVGVFKNESALLLTRVQTLKRELDEVVLLYNKSWVSEQGVK